MQEAKDFQKGGMDLDSAVHKIAPNDYLRAWNIRHSGGEEQESDESTNIEGNTLISATRPAGINTCIGTYGFELVRKLYGFIFNSQGYHQIEEIDYDTLTSTILYENLTDSSGIDLLGFNPNFYVTDCKLAQDRYLIFTHGTTPFYVDLEMLRTRPLGAIVQQDFMLQKGQPLTAPISVYNNDTARSVNQLKNRLFQFREQTVKLNYEKTTWGTISKRTVPTNEPTPTFGTNVTINNNLIVSVDAGTDRDMIINIAARYDLLDWFLVKSVRRTDVVALPNTTVDVSLQVYEAYDPSTNIYSFAFYNDELYEDIDVLETDENYDHIWESSTLELINGSLLVLGGLIEGYDRPTVDVNISTTVYDPQISIPSVPPNSMAIARTYNNIRSPFTPKTFYGVIDFVAGGLPKTGDKIIVKIQNLYDATDIITYPVYVVPAPLEDNMQGVVDALAATLPDSATGPLTITFGPPASYLLLSVTIDLANAGSGASRSIHGVKSNSSYQLALAHYDMYGRYFPIVTDNRFVQKTPSYALTHGLLAKFDWQINSLPPANAATYQWLLSLNLTHETDLFINGAYDASRSTSDYIVFNIKSLKKFNDTNSSSVLGYEYSKGDRCTFLFTFLNTSTPIKWFDTAAIDVEVVGFDIVVDTVPEPDVTNYFLKVRKSSSLVIGDIVGKEVLLEVYSPRKRTITTGDVTVNAPTLFFEVGEVYPIVNGDYSVKQGSITEGDNYFKTRGLTGNIDPNILYNLLVEDFNFSDFYKSDYTSYGRPRSYDDERGRIEMPEYIRNSQRLGNNKVNGLNRFYGASIYGGSDGQTSAFDGFIQKLRMRGNILVCIQELDVWHIPVNISIIEDQASQNNVAVSEKLLNNVRATIGRFGMGDAKESYAESTNGTIYFVDPNNSLPIRDGYDGLKPISMKMTKYFRRVLKQAKKDGKKIIGYYHIFADEYHISIQDSSGIVSAFVFDTMTWELTDSHTVNPADLVITANSNGVAVLNGDGTATFTPTTGYTGNAGFTFTFLNGPTVITKTSCGTVEAGTTTINNFFFVDLINQPISTLLESNSILISGNNIPVAISIVNGEYQVNGGSWTSVSGMVSAGDNVKVRRTSSASFSTTVSTTLTVSGYSDSFDITTRADEDYDDVTITLSIIEPDPQEGISNRYGFKVVSDHPLTADVTINFSINYDNMVGGINTYTGSITLPATTLENQTDYVITDAMAASTTSGFVINSSTPPSGSLVTDSTTSDLLNLITTI